MCAAKVDLRDQRAAFQKLTMADRAARHEAIAATKAESIAARRALGTAYLERHPASSRWTPIRPSTGWP